ncbi:hypothetical protein VTL71DRAFT_2767 [Oculimacula yallundae]|uniref:Uncharacterized protein n=1 Tax=Oculimacula yallundae TaxID=86028 RepID=A0ABR4C9U9_9HELO
MQSSSMPLPSSTTIEIRLQVNLTALKRARTSLKNLTPEHPDYGAIWDWGCGYGGEGARDIFRRAAAGARAVVVVGGGHVGYSRRGNGTGGLCKSRATAELWLNHAG